MDPRSRDAATSPRVAGLAAAWRNLAPWFLWLVAPAAVSAFGLAVSLQNHPHFGGDFHAAFWPAGQRVLDGLSPYASPDDPLVGRAVAFVYPAPAALAFAPAALIPREVSDAIFVAVQAGSVAVALWLLKVRDWRVYGAAYLWAAVVSGWLTGNVTLMLVAGVAAAWRWRSRETLCGTLVGLIVAFKLFLWPLGLWLLAARRYRALTSAVGVATAASAVGWLVLGTSEIGRYNKLVHALVDALQNRGFTLMSVSEDLFSTRTPGYVLALGLGALSATACVVVGRRGAEALALTLALLVALLVTPLVWLHYFALLLVPAAIASPTIGPLWSIPLAFWLCVAGATRPDGWQLAVALGTLAAMITVLVGTLGTRRRPVPAGRVRMLPPPRSRQN